MLRHARVAQQANELFELPHCGGRISSAEAQADGREVAEHDALAQHRHPAARLGIVTQALGRRGASYVVLGI